MRISLDRQIDVPLYKQIEEYFRQAILSGALAPNTRLPAVRQLAADLGVNRITVENAYAELGADGLTASRVGSGTYVLPYYPVGPVATGDPCVAWPLWQHDLQTAHRDSPEGMLSVEVLRGPAGRQASRPGSPFPGLISFASGAGDSRLFPVEELRQTIQTVMRRDGKAALEYGDTQGYAPLRATIAQLLASQGLRARAENVLITSGSQQAIALVSSVLLRPGDSILVENPTYGGALALFRASGLKVVGIPVDEGGMTVDRLEKLLQQHHPKLIYTIPNFHNPTGTCLSSSRRRQLLMLADRYNVPILEDEFVGDFRYEGRAQPALKALDPGGRVIHISTFSKMLMPGLRVGYVVAEGPVYDALVDRKHFNDLTTSNLDQRVLEAYVNVGRYQSHLRRSSQIYRTRRDAMLKAIHRHLPAGAGVDPPQGGLFVWLRLPGGLSSRQLLPFAWEEGVSFAPGRSFAPGSPDCDDCMRLNFAAQPPEAIEEGIKRLGTATEKLLACSSDWPL